MAFGEIMVEVWQPAHMDALDVVIFRQMDEHRVSVYRPILGKGGYGWDWVEQATAEPMGPPSLRIPQFMTRMGVVQQLVDQLIKRTGVEPTGVRPHKNEVGRLEDHLDDLRKVLFGFDYISAERGIPETITTGAPAARVVAPERGEEEEG
jgi:hypothetical protein